MVENVNFLQVKTIAEVQPYSLVQCRHSRVLVGTHHGTKEGSVYRTKIRHFCRVAGNEGGGAKRRRSCQNSTILIRRDAAGQNRAESEFQVWHKKPKLVCLAEALEVNKRLPELEYYSNPHNALTVVAIKLEADSITSPIFLYLS